MKKGLVYSLFMVLVLCSNSTIAQHETNEHSLPVGSNEHTYELGLTGMGYHFINIMPETYLNRFLFTQNRGLIFKRAINQKLWLRVMLENERFVINHEGRQYYEVADSFNVAGNYNGNKLAVGIERRWQMTDRLSMNTGIDAQFSQYFYRGIIENNQGFYKHIDNAVYSTTGLSPFAGIQYHISRKVNIGFDVSFDITYIHRQSYIEVTRPEPGSYQMTSNKMDVNPNPIRRIFINYSF
jgi:hypothetical protein